MVFVGERVVRVKWQVNKLWISSSFSFGLSKEAHFLG